MPSFQFYNQGADAYTSCPSLLHKSKFAGTALFEVAHAGVPLNKLVIGKPGSTAGATNGFMDPKKLAGCVDEAKKKGWGMSSLIPGQLHLHNNL
jgi:hypothetical protein